MIATTNATSFANADLFRCGNDRQICPRAADLPKTVDDFVKFPACANRRLGDRPVVEGGNAVFVIRHQRIDSRVKVAKRGRAIARFDSVALHVLEKPPLGDGTGLPNELAYFVGIDSGQDRQHRHGLTRAILPRSDLEPASGLRSQVAIARAVDESIRDPGLPTGFGFSQHGDKPIAIIGHGPNDARVKQDPDPGFDQQFFEHHLGNLRIVNRAIGVFGDGEYDRKYNERTGLAGGYSYLPRTDESRHPLKECFYITVSSNVDDVWLTVANPPSPMKHVLKKRLFHMVAVWDDYIKRCNAIVDMYGKYGMTNIYWLFHTRLWTKGGTKGMGCDPWFGSDTVSIVHEPTGGDAALLQLLRKMHAMGIRTGYYDGYESMLTTHKWFQPDWCKYQPDGNWHMRHGPVMKPWALTEYASTVYRKRAQKFGAQVFYQDGWTSSNPSAWNDYDHRYPESGKFIDTLRALAAGWQRCRENGDGPVFSEGRGGDYYTAGLNDGDYSKLPGDTNEKPADEDRNELLVDFRLKKISPLSPSVSLDIGFVRWVKPWSTTMFGWKDFSLYHHFLAAQIAFGTIGMLEPYYDLPDDPHRYFEIALRGYYLLQQLQERYIMEPVAEIRYFDGERLVTSSEAILRGIYRENRLRVCYDNGLVVFINTNWDGKHWLVEDRGQVYDLPPGGWLARQGDDFLEYSAIQEGKRVDFVNSPEYVYLDGLGSPVTVNGYSTTNQFIKFKTGRRAGTEVRYPEP